MTRGEKTKVGNGQGGKVGGTHQGEMSGEEVACSQNFKLD